jgi:large subunit ribosomal protein L17
MRHSRKTVKLGRSQSHRDALLANQVVSLIEHSKIRTTLAKAKAVRPFAEKLVTIGKKNTLHARRVALSYLRHNETAVKALFDKVAPRCASRQGGYTRIVKVGQRKSDASEIEGRPPSSRAALFLISFLEGCLVLEEDSGQDAGDSVGSF